MRAECAYVCMSACVCVCVYVRARVCVRGEVGYESLSMLI